MECSPHALTSYGCSCDWDFPVKQCIVCFEFVEEYVVGTPITRDPEKIRTALRTRRDAPAG